MGWGDGQSLCRSRGLGRRLRGPERWETRRCERVWESWEAAGWEASALAGQLLNCWGGLVRLVKAKVRVEQETGVLRVSVSA